MRQRTFQSSKARLAAAVAVQIDQNGMDLPQYRAGVRIGTLRGAVVAQPIERTSLSGNSVYHFLYKIYIKLPADVAVDDTLFATSHYYLVHDFDSDSSLLSAVTCLCERLRSGP